MAETLRTKKDLSMENPIISVLMPVYNSELYLKEAIDSILNQTFPDFEIIIIDDGSTDSTAEIIEKITDPRIVLLKNKNNLGLVASLNRGIDIVRGAFIARMDGDDVSVLNRLETQLLYLLQHKDVAVVASRVQLINSEGVPGKDWETDVKTISQEEIEATMPATNCIAHPSVLIRAEVLKKYKYAEHQNHAEDWDLWLRLLTDKHRIHKIDIPLLNYRIHCKSAMAIEKNIHTLRYRLIKIKLLHLLYRFPFWNSYSAKIFFSVCKNTGGIVLYDFLPKLTRAVKRWITTSPIRLFKEYRKLKAIMQQPGNLFFFFPYTHIGGAEKVHAEIANSLIAKNIFIFFTNFSSNKKYLARFPDSSYIMNIPAILNHPLTKIKCITLISKKINQTKNAKVLGCNSGFFYDLCRNLSTETQIFDLIHAFLYKTSGDPTQEKYLSVASKFKNRIFGGRTTLNDFKKFLIYNHENSEAISKLLLISNGVEIRLRKENNRQSSPLKVIFAGRNSPEKRIHLYIKIAKQMHIEKPGKFLFSVIGMKAEMEGLTFHGEIEDDNQMDKLYNNADVLLLTSSREGFPLVVMEAMANGVIPICTKVGDIPSHIEHGRNGFCVENCAEDIVCNNFCEILSQLEENQTLTQQISQTAYDYAREHFSMSRFREAYRKLLE